MNRVVKAVLVVLFFYLALMGLLGLQYLFDRSDMKKAAQVVYEFRPPGDSEEQGALTLAQIMAQVFSVSADRLQCETEIVSRYEGRVRVECGRQGGYQENNPQENFQWDINVISGQIIPVNAKAKGLVSWQTNASEF